MDNKKHSVIYIAYCILLAVFLACTILTTKAYDDTDEKENYLNIGAMWKNKFDVSIDISTYDFSDKTNEHVFYYTIPADLTERQFYIRTDFVGYQLYLNNTLIYDYCSKMDNNGEIPAPSERIIDMGNARQGDKLKLVVFNYDYVFGYGIEQTYVGSFGSSRGENFESNVINLILSSILIFSSLILFLLHFPFHKILKKTHGLLYLGWFSLCFGTAFLFANSIALDFFSYGQRLWSISKILMVFSVVPMMLYLIESAEKSGVKNLLRITAWVNLASVSIMLMTITTHAISFNLITILNCVIMAFDLVVLVTSAVLNTISGGKNIRHDIIYLVLLSVSVIGGILDIVTFKTGSLFLSLAAAVVFVIVISSVNVKEVIGMLEIGLRAKIIDKLAYTDGLTGVGNTTAFREKLDTLEVTKVNYSTIGIIQLDINNLKNVNDTLGHSFGDELIKNGSRLIKKAFEDIGNVYRIGGDEFAVITTLPNAAILCEQATIKFEDMIAAFNAEKKHKYDIQIAYGVAFYENSMMGKDLFLRDIQRDADVRMYNMKRKMKSEHKTAVHEGEKTIIPDKTITL